MEEINVGVAGDDHSGDSFRLAFQKANQNFAELLAGQSVGSDVYNVADITKVNANPVSFNINTFRYGRGDGSFAAYTANQAFLCTESDTYIIADCRSDVISLYKGSRGNAWEEAPYLAPNMIILAYKETGFWRSHYVNIQNCIDSKDTFTLTEIVVRTGGAIGTNCDFTDIKSALDSITINNKGTRYIVRVMDGTYDISNNGFDFLGFKNYVDIIGQSRGGVKIIKRDSTFSGSKAGFDPAYYGQSIEYASIRNLTIITKNCKCPIHTDSTHIAGLLEVWDCNLINEEPSSSAFYQVGLACGLNQNQKVKAYNCYSNGTMYAHNSTSDYAGAGCEFELHNCIFPWTTVGDLGTYGLDKYTIRGCKFEYAKYVWSDSFGLRSYAQPAFTVDMSGNSVEYTFGEVVVGGTVTGTNLWDTLFGGKFSMCDASIHQYCKNVSSSTIARGDKVSLDVDISEAGVRGQLYNWPVYGVALDAIAAGDVGVIQYQGTVFLPADGAVAIAFNDAVQLNSSGVVVKHSDGIVIGTAREALSTGTATIKVKLSPLKFDDGKAPLAGSPNQAFAASSLTVGVGKLTSGTQTDDITTTPKSIYTSASGYGAVVFVYGSNGSTHAFIDMVSFGYGGALNVISSGNTVGSSPARTYSKSGSSTLMLSIASTTVFTKVIPFEMN